jgi:hypothetical protein
VRDDALRTKIMKMQNRERVKPLLFPEEGDELLHCCERKEGLGEERGETILFFFY